MGSDAGIASSSATRISNRGELVHSRQRERDTLCECYLNITLFIQLPMLIARWKQILFGALFQYFHGMSTQLAHRMHQPQEEPLGDLGFTYLPVCSIITYYCLRCLDDGHYMVGVCAGAWFAECLDQ